MSFKVFMCTGATDTIFQVLDNRACPIPRQPNQVLYSPVKWEGKERWVTKNTSQESVGEKKKRSFLSKLYESSYWPHERRPECSWNTPKRERLSTKLSGSRVEKRKVLNERTFPLLLIYLSISLFFPRFTHLLALSVECKKRKVCASNITGQK